MDFALHNSVSIWYSKHTRIRPTTLEFEKCIHNHWVIIHSHSSLWSICEETRFSQKGWIFPLSIILGTAQPRDKALGRRAKWPRKQESGIWACSCLGQDISSSDELRVRKGTQIWGTGKVWACVEASFCSCYVAALCFLVYFGIVLFLVFPGPSRKSR